MKLEIALIRHGQIRPEARLTGVNDEPLGEDGKALIQAKSEAGEYPEAPIVFSSRLSRCLETAGIIYRNVPVVVLKELGAPDYGDFDGKAYSELGADKNFAAWSNSVVAAACPNGEEPYAMLSRSAAVFGRIVDEMAAKGLERVAVVTHRMIIQSILNRYIVPRSNYTDWEILPGCGYLLRYDTIDAAVEILNKI